MSLSVIIGMVVGLAFLYALLSLVASGINELISSVFALRARTLRQGVENLLDDPSTAAGVYDHPLVRSLFRSRRLPSYIPAPTFALALLDSNVTPAVGATRQGAAAVTAAIAELPGGRTKDTLDVLWREAKHDADRFRIGVEIWFDQAMERVSGWYRRLVQIILVVTGACLAVGLNVNTVTIAQRLWTDTALRNAVVEQAQQATPPAATDKQGVESALDNIESGLRGVDGLSLPIGWGEDARPSTWYGALAGWTLTTLAISLGAPFWFDVLGRAARLRSTGVRLRTSEPASAEREPQEGARAEEPGAARP